MNDIYTGLKPLKLKIKKPKKVFIRYYFRSLKL